MTRNGVSQIFHAANIGKDEQVSYLNQIDKSYHIVSIVTFTDIVIPCSNIPYQMVYVVGFSFFILQCNLIFML
jgi:hypothetical protein